MTLNGGVSGVGHIATGRTNKHVEQSTTTVGRLQENDKDKYGNEASAGGF
jgi:hypothetical protein